MDLLIPINRVIKYYLITRILRRNLQKNMCAKVNGTTNKFSYMFYKNKLKYEVHLEYEKRNNNEICELLLNKYILL